ncbi:MAG: M56 family metallopeptidase [Hyalangium sp.]|uniref:M56 family metallopeptidase n=1 Tax=Hyalangium sp. TaxID=2028555 RepID=UPI00389AC823
MNGLVLESLGWALLHLLWQGALVAAVLAVALRVLGRRAAVARYALACCALVMMLALPMATGWRHYSTASARTVELSLTPSSIDAPATFMAGVERLPAPRRPAVAAAPVSTAATASEPLLERALALVGQHLPWLVLAWGLGVALSSLRLLAGWMRLRRHVREAVAAPIEWQERLEGLSRRLGLKRAVRLLQSAALDVPSAVGWLRPVVLLPASALTGLPPRQLEMILAHELAHILRYDFAVNLAQTLVETLLFYHPAVWWMSDVIRVEREHCCDDIAASTSGSTLSYARALTALEELRVLPSLAPSPALSALGGSLPERVRRLVVSPASRCSSRWVAGASVLTLISSLAVAAPVTALMLPAQGEHVVVAAAPPPNLSDSQTGSSSIAPPPPPAPIPVAAPALPPTPEPTPGPMRHVAASPKAEPHPNPNPNPNPRHGRDGDDDDNDDDDELDGRTVVGEGKLSVDQLVELKVAGVSPETVEAVKGMGYQPTVSNLVEFGHAGVTPEYAKDMNARFGQKLSADELVEMKHMGVTPAWLEAMKAQGFTKVTPDDVISARAVGVDEDYLRGLKAAGYTGLSLEKLTEMRAVGVKPETISELAKAGYTKLDADTLVELRSVGVSPDYIRELREAGLKDLSTEELVELRSMGVNSDFIRQMHEAGLEALNVKELIRLKSSGIDADFIRRMKQPKK